MIVSEEEEEGEDGDIVELPDEDVCMAMLIEDLIKNDIGMINTVEVVELPDEDVSVLTENVHDDTGKIELPDEEVSLLIEDLVSEVVDLLIVDKVTDGIRDLVDQVDQIEYDQVASLDIEEEPPLEETNVDTGDLFGRLRYLYFLCFIF